MPLYTFHQRLPREEGVLVIGIEEWGRIGEEMGARMTFSRPKATHGVLVELDEDQ